MSKPKPNEEWKSYGVYLETDLVKRAKKLLSLGQKLSPIINDLLSKWVIKQEEANKK